MGEYVTFVDSDDYVATDTYRIAYEEAQKANACAVFFGIQNEYKKVNGRYKKYMKNKYGKENK